MSAEVVVNVKEPGSRRFERAVVAIAIVLLAIACYLLLRPFLIAFLWGAIISVSTRGLYHRVAKLLRGHSTLAATLTSLLLVAVLLVPIAALAVNVAAQMPALAGRFNQMLDGGLREPPAWLAGVPLVGKSAAAQWREFAAHPELLREKLRPYLRPLKDFLVTAVSGVAVGVLQFALALFISGLLYVQGDRFAATVDRIAFRLGGETGRRQVKVVRSTVKGVFKGVLGTCAAQAVLALIGFLVAGVPQAFLLGMGTFFLSIVPGGPTILWLPAALWLNSNGETGWAIFMFFWGLIVVGGSDNFIRPLLIGKGVEAPMSIVFIGVIGGLLAFGFLGLFIGPTVLSVAYNLFQDWMENEAPTPAPAKGATG